MQMQRPDRPNTDGFTGTVCDGASAIACFVVVVVHLLCCREGYTRDRAPHCNTGRDFRYVLQHNNHISYFVIMRLELTTIELCMEEMSIPVEYSLHKGEVVGFVE